MSLFIDIDKVVGVLLHDGWHDVRGKSFELDAYEFQHRDVLRLGGGAEDTVSAMGARWQEPHGYWIACPLSSIIAVKCP
jgi:hypothetical protein